MSRGVRDPRIDEAARLMRECEITPSDAARRVGISRQALHMRLKREGMLTCSSCGTELLRPARLCGLCAEEAVLEGMAA